MTALVELLGALLKLLQRALARQEQQRHEETVDEIQDNPGAFMSGHFGGVPKLPDDPDADKAVARSRGAD
jgi:hypothetical protein